MTSIRRLVFTTVLCAVGLGAGSAYAQSAAGEAAMWRRKVDDLLTAFTQPQREQFMRVLEQLRSADPNDPTWDRLANPTLEVPKIDWDKEELPEPKAGAKATPGGGAHTRIDQAMFLRIVDQSFAAARQFTAGMSGADIARATGTSYDLIAQETHDHVLAWLFAHEIAHHRLGHTKISAKTVAERRSLEETADWHAYDALNKAGYSLPLVVSYLEFKANEEAARRRAGQKINEQLLDHPTWEKRRAQLETYMRTVPPAPRPWMMFSTIRPAGAGVLKVMYLLPVDSRSLGFVWAENKQTMAGVERVAGGASIYQRFDTSILKSSIENPGNYFSRLRIQTAGMPDLELVAYRDSFSGTAAADKTGVIASALVDPFERIQRAVDALVAEPGKRQIGKLIYRQRADELAHLHLRYFKGELSLQASAQAEQQIKTQYAERLDRALGKNVVQAVDEHVMRSVLELFTK